jgi:hypothetical protein
MHHSRLGQVEARQQPVHPLPGHPLRAAPHTKARERKIRWTPRQRARRLCFVVNNSRFLVLPERQRYPDLASRVLALGLKRLNADWQQHWGHPKNIMSG